jgi:flagellar hook assembly protein FlgD
VADATVRSLTVPAAAGTNSVVWDGRNNVGAIVPDGAYTIRFTPRDAVGNTGPGATRPLTVVNLLGFAGVTAPLFFPQDGDRLAPLTGLSFQLARPATVTWTIRDAADQVVATRLQDAAVGAGSQTWSFNGRRDNGSMLPTGTYTSVVTATDGTYTTTLARGFEMNAFSIRPSTTVLRRGTRLTVTATTAERLSTATRLYVYQPGLTVWSVPMTKVDATRSKATITLKSGGRAGTVRFKVAARDVDGRAQYTNRSFALR